MKKTSDTIAFTFGRFQPVHPGHIKLFKAMEKFAKSKNADMSIFMSHTKDNKDNPLTWSEKVQFVERSFPKLAKYISRDSKLKNIFAILSYLIKEMGYKKIYFLVGADRYEDFLSTFRRYRKNYDIKDFYVVKVGSRDGQPSGTEIRKAAEEGNLEKFDDMMKPTQHTKSSTRKFYDELHKRLAKSRKNENVTECVDYSIISLDYSWEKPSTMALSLPSSDEFHDMVDIERKDKDSSKEEKPSDESSLQPCCDPKRSWWRKRADWYIKFSNTEDN